MNEAQILARIDAIFQAAGASSSIVPASVKAGKMYEAWTLAQILKSLSIREGFSVQLINGKQPVLKSSPGPINPNYPCFELRRSYRRLRIWTDVEFVTMGSAMRGVLGTPDPGDKHELDIVVVDHSVSGYPAHHELVWGVECKNTSFEKHMARAALGVRRELSLLTVPTPTMFRRWPAALVPADPPSVLTVYSTSPAVLNFADAGETYGVSFQHLPLP